MDQPPLTPLLAAVMDTLAPGSLLALRLPSALAAAGVVVLTGLLAREFGGGRAAQLLAAASMAVSAVLLLAGHLLSTTTLDLLVWTALSWLLVRAIRDGGPWWLAVGAVAGIGLQNKLHPAFLMAAVAVGVLTVWPQLQLAEAIAAGSSGTSEPWYLFVPFQLVLVSPLLVPIWVSGLWRLTRDPDLLRWRAFAVAFAVLTVLFLVTGGKPYYLAGLYPVLLAAGAGPVVEWAHAGRRRTAVVGAALVVSLGLNSLLMLPLVPVGLLGGTPIADINYDAGETVGWPRLAAAVEEVRADLPAGERIAVLTANDGEAGAIDRFVPRLGPAYSAHNA